MAKKLTYEFVKSEIEKRGYELISREYHGNREKLEILCSTLGHGIFEITFTHFYNRGDGCSICTKKKKKTIEEVRKIVRERGYELISNEYYNNKGKLKMLCSVGGHGVFYIAFTHFHNRGNGCQKCGIESRANKRKYSYEYIKECIENEDSRGYRLVSKTYVGSHSNLKVLCPFHGNFHVSFSNLMSGKGCVKCAKYGFKTNKKSVLYYLHVIHRKKSYYKIGITNRSVKDRYQNKDLEKIRIVAQWEMNGQECLDKETQILNKYSYWKYRGKASILSSGNTELFTRDVLNLDN